MKAEFTLHKAALSPATDILSRSFFANEQKKLLSIYRSPWQRVFAIKGRALSVRQKAQGPSSRRCEALAEPFQINLELG